MPSIFCRSRFVGSEDLHRIGRKRSVGHLLLGNLGRIICPESDTQDNRTLFTVFRFGNQEGFADRVCDKFVGTVFMPLSDAPKSLPTDCS